MSNSGDQFFSKVCFLFRSMTYKSNLSGFDLFKFWVKTTVRFKKLKITIQMTKTKVYGNLTIMSFTKSNEYIYLFFLACYQYHNELWGDYLRRLQNIVIEQDYIDITFQYAFFFHKVFVQTRTFIFKFHE